MLQLVFAAGGAHSKFMKTRPMNKAWKNKDWNAPHDASQPDMAAAWYSRAALWRMLGRSARWAGEKLVRQALALYFCLCDRDTPMWAKSTIVAALGYVIMPLDAIPDFLPMIGLSDDVGAVSAAIVAVMRHLKKEHYQRAEACWKRWSMRPGSDRPPSSDDVWRSVQTSSAASEPKRLE